MTYEELKINIDLYDPEDVLYSVGRLWHNGLLFVVCDEGDCHLFKRNGTEDDIGKVDSIFTNMIPFAIKKIVIPDSVTSIEYAAFSYCTNLVSVTIGNNVTSIEEAAFSNCKNLTNVVIPDNVKEILSSAFYRCSGLTSVTIPDSVTSIMDDAFCGCNRLKSVTITANGGDALNVKKMMIDADISKNIDWNLPD